MKTKNLFAILLVLTLLICTFVIPTSAKESTLNNRNVEIIINSEVSAETKAKIERYFATGEPATDGDVLTYGLTCTLFGHEIESTVVSTINHKVRSTSPRCLKKIYDYEACTRCDYENAELAKSSYIVCCS